MMIFRKVRQLLVVADLHFDSGFRRGRVASDLRAGVSFR